MDIDKIIQVLKKKQATAELLLFLLVYFVS